MVMNAEKQRLQDINYRTWDLYVSNRQWGNVREDYSFDGNTWEQLVMMMQKAELTDGQKKESWEFLMINNVCAWLFSFGIKG